MRALITGASSGIGREIAKVLAGMGYDLILVARSRDQLESLQRELTVPSELYVFDLSDIEACYRLYDAVSPGGLDVLINNAGYGHFGQFLETDLKIELNLIDLNIRAVHILTKLFLKDFVARNHGMIMNVASMAAFTAGPLMSSYYASKNYVLRLTQAINEELRHSGQNVHVCALCPGPVKTNFNRRAGVGFMAAGLSSAVVARYAVRQMMRGRTVIIPGLGMRILRILMHLAPDRLMLAGAYSVQKLKGRSS